MRNKGLDLRHHSFGRAVRGLDETEVLSFLQATAPDYEQAHADIAALRQQVEDAAVELKRLQDQERTLTRVLVAAEEDARVRLEATAKQVAEIERKAEERVRALVANAETQRARMQDEVRAIVARRAIAANGLTELIDALSRRAGQAAAKPPVAATPQAAAAPAPPRVVQPVPTVPPPVAVVPSVVPPTAAVEAPPVVTVAAPPAVSVAPPAVPAPLAAPAPPAPPAEPIAEPDRPVTLTTPADEFSPEVIAASDAPLDVEYEVPVVEHAAPFADATDNDRSGTKRAWWVAAAGVVLAVTTAAALGIPHLGSATEQTQASAVAKPKAAAPAATPKLVKSDVADTHPAAPPVAPAVATPSAPLTVTLRANRECWLRLVVDGRTETKTLAQGEELTRGATREIELRVGDASAISVIVNGRPLAPLGRSGQVVDTVFHPDLAGSR